MDVFFSSLVCKTNKAFVSWWWLCSRWKFQRWNFWWFSGICVKWEIQAVTEIWVLTFFFFLFKFRNFNASKIRYRYVLKVVPRFPNFHSLKVIAFSIYSMMSPDINFSVSSAGLWFMVSHFPLPAILILSFHPHYRVASLIPSLAPSLSYFYLIQFLKYSLLGESPFLLNLKLQCATAAFLKAFLIDHAWKLWRNVTIPKAP